MSLIHLLSDHIFGSQFQPDDLEVIMKAPSIQRSLAVAQQVGNNKSSSPFDKDGFHVCLDVQHFTPEDISVKTVDNSLIVEGRHEMKDEHGFFTRQFMRRYELPENYDLETLKSSLSADGILHIKADPPKEEAIEHKVTNRIIPLEFTGPVREPILENSHYNPLGDETMDEDFND